MLNLVIHSVVLKIQHRQGHFTADTLIRTTRRHQSTVTGVTRPTNRCSECMRIFTELLNVVLIALRRIRIQIHHRVFPLRTQEHTIGFRNRNTPAHGCTARFINHVSNVLFFQVDFANVEIQRTRDTFVGDVRFGQGHGIGLIGVGIVDRHAKRLTRTKDIVLRETGRQNQTVRRRETGTQGKATRRAFKHIHFQVHLVTRTRNRLVFNRHVIEVTQTVNTVTRNLDLIAVEPSGFVLTHFTTDHFVLRLRVTRNVHLANISTTTRVNGEDYLHVVATIGRHRRRTSRSKGITQARELIHDGVRCIVDGFSVIRFTEFNFHQRLQFVFETQEVTGQTHIRQAILFAFRNVNRNKDVFLIRSDGHLDAIDLEVQVTVVEIERADGFNVCSQLFTRIEVLLVVPGHPTGLAQLHLFG